MPSFKDYFNSNTMNGRANVAKATYASIAIWYLWHRARKPKKSDPPTSPPPPKHEPFNECCEIKPEPKCECERKKESPNDAPTNGASSSPPLDDGCRYKSGPFCDPPQGHSGQSGHGDGNPVKHTKASGLIPEPVPAEAQKPGNPEEPRTPITAPNQRKHISIWFD